jgi:hypothetical protein
MCIENWLNYVTAIIADVIWPNLVRKQGTYRLLLRYVIIVRCFNSEAGVDQFCLR